VSARRPKLVDGVRLIEQRFQGEPGFVVKRPQGGAYLRFRPAEARVIAMFTGDRTIGEIAQQLTADGLALSASAIDAFATKLAGLGLVERTMAEQSSAQLERLRQERRQRRKKPLFRGELMRMRFSIGDPDALLTRTFPLVRWCFTRPFVYASLAIFALYATVMTTYWSQLSANFTTLMDPRSLTVGTVVLFWAVFIFIGTVHELGHAYACKAFTGSVNEMGFMIVYFQPAFYCNVNDAWAFPDLRHRLWVTAAGGWIELLLAAVSAAVWLIAKPGTMVSEVAMLVTVLGGGLTLLTNANPLLPLDGYFALSDWLDIPNLRQRAMAHTRWFLATRMLGRDIPEPVVTDRERRIFLWYGLLGIAYLAFVYWFLLGVVLGWVYRTFGLGVAVTFVAALLVWQRQRLTSAWFAIRDTMRELYRLHLRTHLHRLPAPLRGRWALGALAMIVLLLPWPHRITGTWTALPAEHTVVTAPIDGIVSVVPVFEGDDVRAGVTLVQIVNRDLDRALPARVGARDSLQLLEREARSTARGDLASLEAEAGAAGTRAANTEYARRAGTVRATIDGRVLTTEPQLLVGRTVRAGTPLLSLGNPDSLEVRVRLHGAGATLVRAGQPVSLLLDADAAHPVVLPIAEVAPVAGAGEAGVLEARVWLPATGAWRAGTGGVARVRIGRTTIGGALLWAVRSRISPDLWL
jgi:putative peptide zinc metalloprotease protein